MPRGTCTNASYTRPTVSYTRPTVNHQHMHSYNRAQISSGGISFGGGGNRLSFSTPLTAGHNADPVVSGGGVSISGGGVSISGGGVSLSGDVSLSGGSISGGGASHQPQPAPYIQLLACQRS